MKVPILILLIASAAAGVFASPLSAALGADAAPSAVVLPAQEEKAEMVNPLDASMDVLKKGQRALRKQIKDPKANKAELMENLKGMEAAAYAAIVLEPNAVKEMPKGEVDAFLLSYKQKMTMLLVNILSMEDAAMRESADDLAAAYKAISETKKSGHEKFRDR